MKHFLDKPFTPAVSKSIRRTVCVFSRGGSVSVQGLSFPTKAYYTGEWSHGKANRNVSWQRRARAGLHRKNWSSSGHSCSQRFTCSQGFSFTGSNTSTSVWPVCEGGWECILLACSFYREEEWHTSRLVGSDLLVGEVVLDDKQTKSEETFVCVLS